MDQYGLIGYPLQHSFSKDYFNAKFTAEKTNAEYINFEISSLDELKDILVQHPNLKGLNVTIPYKEKVIPYLNEMSENAKLIGAVNVIKIQRKKNKAILTGYNSDIIGFKDSIEPMLPSHNVRALVLGTGGAAKAVFYGLRQLGLSPIYVSRTRSNDTQVITYEDITSEIMASHPVIVNCTPVGMWPHVEECPPIPYQFVTEQHLLYDLLYNPDETMFMRLGKERGATVENGLKMLLLQAFAGWGFWNS